MRFSARRFWRPSETALLHQGESMIRAEKLCGWDLFWQIWFSRAPLFSQSLPGNLKCSQPESWTKAWGPWTSWWQVLGNAWIHFSPLLLIFKVLQVLAKDTLILQCLRVLFFKNACFINPLYREIINYPLCENSCVLSKDLLLRSESHFINHLKYFSTMVESISSGTYAFVHAC